MITVHCASRLSILSRKQNRQFEAYKVSRQAIIVEMINCNKTGTSQVGAISKAQINRRRDPLETQKKFEKM